MKVNYLEIEKYLQGELTKEETALFEDKLAKDSDLAEQVKLYKEIEGTLRSRAAHKEEEEALKNSLKEIREELTPNKVKPKVFTLSRVSKFLVAASLVFFAVVLWQGGSDPSYMDFNKHQKMDMVVRGDTDKELLTAQEAFNAKNYELAEKKIRSVLYADPTQTELQLYLGISLIEQDKYKNAENVLESIWKGTSIYKNKALWYLALNKLKQKDYEGCQNYLKMIPKDADDFKKSQKLLKKLP